jgi:hypothetical protein
MVVGRCVVVGRGMVDWSRGVVGRSRGMVGGSRGMVGRGRGMVGRGRVVGRDGVIVSLSLVRYLSHIAVVVVGMVSHMLCSPIRQSHTV